MMSVPRTGPKLPANTQPAPTNQALETVKEAAKAQKSGGGNDLLRNVGIGVAAVAGVALIANLLTRGKVASALHISPKVANAATLTGALVGVGLLATGCGNREPSYRHYETSRPRYYDVYYHDYNYGRDYFYDDTYNRFFYLDPYQNVIYVPYDPMWGIQPPQSYIDYFPDYRDYDYYDYDSGNSWGGYTNPSPPSNYWDNDYWNVEPSDTHTGNNSNNRPEPTPSPSDPSNGWDLPDNNNRPDKPYRPPYNDNPQVPSGSDPWDAGGSPRPGSGFPDSDGGVPSDNDSNGWNQ